MATKVLNPKSTLHAEVKRLTDSFEWEVRNWGADYSAVAIIRTVLSHMGCKEELSDKFAKDRQDLVDEITPMLECGAPINFQRTMLVNSGLAPKKAATEEPKAAAKGQV